MLNKFFTVAFILLCSVNLWSQARPAAGAAPARPASGGGSTPAPAPSSTTDDAQRRAAESRRTAAAEEEGRAEVQNRRSQGQTCDSQARTYSENVSKYRGYCSQAGGGGEGTDCESLMQECQEEIQNFTTANRDNQSAGMQALRNTSASAMQSSDGFAQMFGAAGTAYSSSLANVQGRCPRMGSRDYNTQYREINTNIREINKRLSEERKDILKKQADLEKEQQDITKDSNKAQESYEKAKADLARRQQEQAERHFENTQKAQKTLGEVETRLLRLNAEYQKALSDETSTTQQYMAYAERNITASCRAQVQKQRTELMMTAKQKQGSSMNLIKQGTETNKTLQNLFSSCYAAQDQRLKSDLEDKRTRKAEVQDAIKKMEEERQRVTEAISNAEDSLKKANEMSSQEQSREEQKYMNEINSLQQRLESAANKFQREQQRSTAELNTMNTELQTAQTELAGLGPRPDGDTDGIGFGAAIRARDAANNAAAEYRANNCCNREGQTTRNAAMCTEPRSASSNDDATARGRDGGGSGSGGGTNRNPPRVGNSN